MSVQNIHIYSKYKIYNTNEYYLYILIIYIYIYYYIFNNILLILNVNKIILLKYIYYKNKVKYNKKNSYKF